MFFGNEKNPKGPDWKRLRTVHKSVSGTQVQLSAPVLRLPLRGRSELEEQPDAFDLSDPAIYRPYEKSESEGGIQDALIWLSGWNFTGRPFLDGETLGDLVLRLSVLNVKDLPVNQSLFTHSTMVGLVERLHNTTDIGRYHAGHNEDRNPFDLTKYCWPNYLSPINSQWLSRNGTEWLYFETQPLWSGPHDFFWLSPIGHNQCLLGHFMVNQWLQNAGNPYRQAQRSPTTNYRELMERVMDTMVVRLSDVAEAERSSVRDQVGGYPLPGVSTDFVMQAKHTLYMWSGLEFADNSKPSVADQRAPKAEVARFIDQRIRPRPLSECLAIGSASIEDASMAGCRGVAELPAPVDK